MGRRAVRGAGASPILPLAELGGQSRWSASGPGPPTLSPRRAGADHVLVQAPIPNPARPVPASLDGPRRALLVLDVLLAVGAAGGSWGLISGSVDASTYVQRLPFQSTVFGGVALAATVCVPAVVAAGRDVDRTPVGSRCAARGGWAVDGLDRRPGRVHRAQLLAPAGDVRLGWGDRPARRTRTAPRPVTGVVPKWLTN